METPKDRLIRLAKLHDVNCYSPYYQQHCEIKNAKWIEFSNWFMWGDYGGDTVTRANYNVFTSEFENESWFLHHYESYNCHTILIEIEKFDSENAIEILEALENYPLINENELCLVENEIFEEYWNQDLENEFQNKLREHLENLEWNEHAEFIETHNLKVWDLYRWLCEQTNTYAKFESAVSCYVDIDRLLTPIGKQFRTFYPVSQTFNFTEQIFDRILFPEKYEIHKDQIPLGLKTTSHRLNLPTIEILK